MPSFGTLKADTLTHSTAGSLATNFVVEGSAKAWFKLDGTGTIGGLDSFNIASFTDNGTGDYSGTFTSAMGNANYAAVANTGSSDVFGSIAGGSQATTLVRVTAYFHSTSAKIDRDQVYTLVAGDLA